MGSKMSYKALLNWTHSRQESYEGLVRSLLFYSLSSNSCSSSAILNQPRRFFKGRVPRCIVGQRGQFKQTLNSMRTQNYQNIFYFSCMVQKNFDLKMHQGFLGSFFFSYNHQKTCLKRLIQLCQCVDIPLEGLRKTSITGNKTNQPEYDISFVEIFIKSQYTPSEYSLDSEL